MLISIGRSCYYFVVLRCSWFSTKATSAYPLLEIIIRVYCLKFAGLDMLNMNLKKKDRHTHVSHQASAFNLTSHF